MTKTVMLVAGEASGDKHGGEIAKKLIEYDESIRCIGMGGKAMRNAGVELLVDSRNIAVVGLFEVLTHWGDIQKALKTLKQALKKNPPDLLVLIDYQEFNLKLAEFAKSLHTRVLFYVSPQVWAWRQGRVKKIGKAIDMMAVIFPFEAAFYEKHNVPVRYVGHPLADKVKPSLTKQQAIEQFQLDPCKKSIALLPGSRRSEIIRILPILIESANIIRRSLENVQFVLPVAPSLDIEFLQMELEKAKLLGLTLIEGHTYDAVAHSDAVIVASGTATLEVALLGTPMAIVYRVSGLSYAVFKRLLKVKHVGLANIVAEREVAKEFIQDNARPEDIAAEIVKQLSDSEYQAAIREQLKIVTHKLGANDGIQGVSDLVIEMLNHPKGA